MKSTYFGNAARKALALATLSLTAHGGSIQLPTIETPQAILSFRAGSGDLTGAQWKSPRLEIIHQEALGENFRILIPRLDYEANYFNSRDQVVSQFEPHADGVVLHYDALRNERETLPVKVTYEIRDTGSQLQFSIRVDNPTDRPLAEVLYGMLGGQQGIGNRLDTESLVPGGFDNLQPGLFNQFTWSGEMYGVRFNSAGFAYPGRMSMGWMDVYNPKAGLGYYYANQDPETRLTALYTEIHPYSLWVVKPEDNWPSMAALPPGEPSGLTMGWINFPYTVKGSFRGGPVALQVHEGDWHAGSKLYRTWFDRYFQHARKPSWLRGEMAWRSVKLLDAEDQVFHRFKDLSAVAADAKRYGITTLELIGWTVGGAGRTAPHYTPDPRLGTQEELRSVLADLRGQGVHPILRASIQFADTDAKDFQSALSRYAVQGRWAPDWQIESFGEGTIGARHFRVNETKTWVSPSHPEFRALLLRQYLARIQDGAQGLMFENAEAIGVPDFNPTAPTSPDKSLMQGVLETLDEFLSRARAIDPEVALAAQMPFDRALPYVDVSRLSVSARDAGSVALRYTFPEWTSAVVVQSPGDFVLINNGLRYGLVWDLALGDSAVLLDAALTKPLAQYLAEMLRIRQQHAALLFHGRFNDTLGAQVTGDPGHVRYSVFTPMNTDDPRACVIVNFGDREESADVSIPGKEGQQATISIPFQPDRVAVLPVKLTVPARRAAVVVIQ